MRIDVSLTPRAWLSRKRVWLSLVLLLALSVAGALATSSQAENGGPDTCRLVHSGKPGPRGNYVVLHRRNSFAGGTVLYRDRRRIRFLTSVSLFSLEGWRQRTSEINCGRVTVRNIDRIVIKRKAGAGRTLVIDQSGHGLRRRPNSPYEFVGPGGPFAPGASGRGIQIKLANPLRRPAGLVYAGSDRSDRVYLARENGMISQRLRTAAGEPLGSLIGFKAWKIRMRLGGGSDLLESAGLGPDPSGHDPFLFLVYGEGGDDHLLGHAGRDMRFNGGPGNDLIRGRGGSDGHTGNHFGLLGESGDDSIYGGAGNDWIDGGSGSDRVYPGPGRDRLHMKDGEADLINCRFDPLYYVAFDEGLDNVVACPGIGSGPNLTNLANLAKLSP